MSAINSELPVADVSTADASVTPATQPPTASSNEIAALPQGELTLQTVAMPADTNWSGDVFGGWLLSQMDLAGAVMARRRAMGRVVTIALDNMVFHVAVKVGHVIACHCRLQKIGRTSLQIFVEVWEVHDSLKPPVKVTEGLFTYVAIDEFGNKRLVPVIE